MKVTISFDGTKIVVPCGDGEISVRELVNLAVTRYKKVIGKPNNFWVSVSNLKSCYEGGMLDPDDLICDVCDDREQLVAIFEEQGRTGDHHGDGMSSEDSSDSKENQVSPSIGQYDNINQFNQARRGSEPNLAKRGVEKANNCNLVTAGTVQAAVANFNAITKIKQPPAEFAIYGSVGRSFSAHMISKQQSQQQSQNPTINQPDFFVRPSPTRSSTDNGRSSLRMTMLPGGVPRNEEYLKVYNFSDRDYDSETLDSLNFDSKCSLNIMRRREPLGASGNKPEKPRSPVFHEPVKPVDPLPVPEIITRVTEELVILNESGPLGIHVVPCDDDGRLVVQGIEPGGRIDRQGHLAVGDEIISINGISLTSSSFARAQDIFKDALSQKELRLEVVKVGSLGGREEMAVEGENDNKENQGDSANQRNSNSNIQRYFDVATSTTGTLTKMPAGTKITTAVNANNTRKIGKVMKISLQKGPLGLGFSITTRDNAPGGNTPIYIKNILPKGAAIEEGSLKPGDRLLEVNGVSVDGMSQSQVVTLLRNAPQDSCVNLVVSRHCVQPPMASPGKTESDGLQSNSKKQHEDHEKESPEKQHYSPQREEQIKIHSMSPLPASTSPVVSSSEDALDEFQFPWKQREILTFDIPVHDSERAGLGVSVKGKTSTSKDGSVVDLGIFVKSVLHGGAASRDGRLKTNDQLVNINGISLLGKHNPSAMETLRKAMHEEGPVPGIISLTVARRRYEDVEGFKSSSSAGTSLNSHGNNSGTFQQQVQQPNLDQRRDSLSSLITSSSDDMVREYNISNQPPIRQQQYRQQQQQPHQQQQQFYFPHPSFPVPSMNPMVSSSLKHVRNPVVDRLMGKDSAGLVPSNLRNDSYYMATHHDTWNASQMQHLNMAPPKMPPPLPPVPSTMHPSDTGDGVIMIEQEQEDFSKPVLQREDDTDMDDKTRESLTSLVEVFSGFSRDQPGRQSMSEKRHATLDAKSTDTYQKRKKAREEKAKEKDSHKQILFKKSASLESLQMIGSKSHLGPEEREAIRNAYVRANSVRVSRNRGCNESFRQAVDRSYEKDFPVDQDNDFVVEDIDPENEDVFTGSPEQPPDVVMRRSKSERDTPSRKKNRNSKLFKGLGTMFRLGSKPVDPTPATRRSKSSSSTNRKSLPGPLAPSEEESSSSRMMPQNPNPNQPLDYRQNFMPKSRSGDLATMSSSRQQTQSSHSHQKRQAPPPPPPFLPNQLRPPPPSHYPRRPGEMYAYEYFPSAMMRPGSRVGIADPAQLSTESADYDVIQRLQHSRPHSEHPTFTHRYNPVYEQAYSLHRPSHHQQQMPHHHGVHLGSQPLPGVHMRTGSNLSSGSSTNNNLNTSGGSGGSGTKLPQRPKSSYFEYDPHNQHHPSSVHHHLQHYPHLYSMPRNSQMYQQNK